MSDYMDHYLERITELEQQLRDANARADLWKTTSDAHAIVIGDLETERDQLKEQLREAEESMELYRQEVAGVREAHGASLEREEKLTAKVRELEANACNPSCDHYHTKHTTSERVGGDNNDDSQG